MKEKSKMEIQKEMVYIIHMKEKVHIKENSIIIALRGKVNKFLRIMKIKTKK